jgi:hypothetical protein
MQQMGDGSQPDKQKQLFLSLAEQLSRPFLQISRLAELAAGEPPEDRAAYWSIVQTVASASLDLVESYALSLRLQDKLSSLEIEPVTVSSLLYDTAHALTPYAKQYGIELELDTGFRLQPILGNREVLESALTSLGQVFILAGAESDEQSPVRLAAHRSRYGVVAGLYGNQPLLSGDSLRRAHALAGKARQPLQRLVSGSAAGVFVAESLLQTLSAHLHVARYHKLTGLGVTLPPSHQLQLV